MKIKLTYFLCLLTMLNFSVFSQDIITETQKLLAGDGSAGDYFGQSVSITGNTAIVGSWQDNDNGDLSGSAYIFEKINGTWTQIAKLLPSDGAAGDLFGCRVSISGDTAIVGAYANDENGTDSGSAYIFEKINGTWTNNETQKLLASDGSTDDLFSYSVSISGNVAIVGAYQNDNSGRTNTGAAYIFEKIEGIWTQTNKLLADDYFGYDYFGCSVSISGDTAIIGAYGNDDNGAHSGSAYIFKKIGETWTQTAKLLASDGAANDYFGDSVSISGDIAIIGAYLDDNNGTDSGSAYIFEKLNENWAETTNLTASDVSAFDFFGKSVSISGDTVIIGAWEDDDNGDSSGSVYTFEKTDGIWTQKAKLLASDGSASDYFGVSVSISGDIAIIGAYYELGSAYVFDLNPSLTINNWMLY